MTPQDFARRMNQLTPEQIAKAMESLPTDALEFGVKFEALSHPAEPEMYYIQHRGFCGDSLMWWRIGRCGYTPDLNQALKVSPEEAEDICRSRPQEDTMRLASMVDGAAQRHLNSESLPEGWKR